MVHSEKMDFLSKEYGEKDRLMEKKHKDHNRQGRKTLKKKRIGKRENRTLSLKKTGNAQKNPEA